MKLLKVTVTRNKVGSMTVQVYGAKENGEILIGVSGGVPTGEVGKAVTLLGDLLDRSGTNVATDWATEEKKPQKITSG